MLDVTGLIMDDPNEQLDEELAQMFGDQVACGGDDNGIPARDDVIDSVDHFTSEERAYFGEDDLLASDDVTDPFDHCTSEETAYFGEDDLLASDDVTDPFDHL